MHPYILQAVANEHIRDLQIEARGYRRMRKFLGL